MRIFLKGPVAGTRNYAPLNSLRRFLGAKIINSSRLPIEEYDNAIKDNKLRDDPYQRTVISSLTDFHAALQQYRPPDTRYLGGTKFKQEVGRAMKNASRYFPFLGKKKELDALPPENSVKGIYLYGDVGCGKTMLMDLFYKTIPEHLTKRRLHFHQFMQHLHKRMHELKVEHANKDTDVLPFLAKEIAHQATVLCFDEFQVTDVADAMLLRKFLLLTMSPDYGIILFATSNRAPDDLYLNGIQRVLFIPCIQLIKRQSKVIYLNSPTDYRKIAKPTSPVYYFPKPGVKYTSKANQKGCKKHEEEWFEYFNSHNVNRRVETNRIVKVWGRDLVVPKSCYPCVAQFSFHELCGKPLAAGDYLTLAHSFQSFVVTGIPYLTINVRDQVRRFITFLDAIYDSRGKIAATAAAPFEDLFVEPENLKDNYLAFAELSTDVDSFEHDDLVVKHGYNKKIAKTASMFASDEERFAFARTLSRLAQMSTSEWVHYEYEPPLSQPLE